jgi:hypothetical protein
MIDLCLCVPGQRVKYRNNAFGTYAGSDNSGDTYQFHTRTNYGNIQSHTRFGWISKSGVRHPYDVVEILPLETPEEEPMPTPQEMDYKREYNEIGHIVSVAFPECEVTVTDMIRLVMHENRTLRMALGLPSYKQVSDSICDEVVE